MDQSKRRVLVLGQTRIGTGYARILDELLPRLCESFHVEQITFGMPTALLRAPWPVHVLDQTSLATERAHLLHLLRSRSAELLLICHDLTRAERYERVIRTIRHCTRVVAYGPVDGPVFSPQVAQALLSVHHVATFTTHQADLLRRALRRQAARLGVSNIPPVSAVGLGVDTTGFRPYASRKPDSTAFLNRREIRRAVFGTDTLRDAFIVLNANQNLIRKRIDLTVAGFARFAARTSSDVFLYLHMNDGGRSAWDLHRLARAHRVESRLLFPSPDRPAQTLSISQLAELYNVCDVGVNTSVAEGWGLVSWEHAATGAAQIVPDHTACAELWGDAALRIRSYRSVVTDTPFYEEYTIDTNDLARKLEALYRHEELLLTKSLQAFHRAREHDLSWKEAAWAWCELFLGELR